MGRWAAQGRPRVPGCRPRLGSGFSRGSKINTQGVYFWVYMEVLRGFRLSSTPPKRACVGAAVPTADSGQRPRPGLATASGDVCSRSLLPHTAGGCDSRRRVRQEKVGPPARSRQPAAALDAGITALEHRRVVRGGGGGGWLGGGPVRGEVPVAPLIGVPSGSAVNELTSWSWRVAAVAPFTKQAPLLI
jgi:hypothetical protein